ncbi:uncharacterized protein ACA1_024430 [Acanthamoeba castellanii str. Neff]|uniref:Uncharacterized protein n=1 Tax=Acanthamoeba castellanii (strain ATCC 30010 / Neff) TaxID=1257118 RepID=L8H7M7_ACACF|nr:uncharacterized protein ACA1_024430 [Acanthamoeba castellanii str. Neff]ELR21242.1 hypothetical protein ACA1_024430 [Acanthamoeba castellanii str. Neff]
MEKGDRNKRVRAGGGSAAPRGRGGGKAKSVYVASVPSTSSTSSSSTREITAKSSATAFGVGRQVVLATTDTGVDAYELRQSPPVLLSDELVRQFIVEGYLMLQPSALPASFHNNLYARVDALNSKWKDNVGNNILPTIPELDLVFEDPTVRGALQSVLGQGYMMHAHRHCHDRRPGSRAQDWHKDSYWGFNTIRHHYPRFVFYSAKHVDVLLG